jgi:hypothetical protein
MTIDVTPVNDAPAGSDTVVTVLEDTQYVLEAADFGFSDAADTPANSIIAVRIASLAGAGSLTLSGLAVVAGQSIAIADINAGHLRFDPASNASGAGYASFTFQVQDGGGTANAGVDMDASANTITIHVTSVNDVPAGTDNVISTAEDVQYTFHVADFGLLDPSDSMPNGLAAVTISMLPGVGSLTLSGAPVLAGQTVSVADVAAGNLEYIGAANAYGNGYASFSFQVQDDGGTLNGGSDLDASANTMTINVTAVNDAPVLAGNSLTVSPGASIVLSGAQLSATDVDDAMPGLLFSVSGLAHGHFELSSSPGIAVISFTQAQLAGGEVRFVHDGSASAPSYAISVSDGSLVDGPSAASISFPLPTSEGVDPLLPLLTTQNDNSASPTDSDMPRAPVDSLAREDEMEDAPATGDGSGESTASAQQPTDESIGYEGSPRHRISGLQPNGARQGGLPIGSRQVSGSHPGLLIQPVSLSVMLDSLGPVQLFSASAHTSGWSVNDAFSDQGDELKKEPVSVLLDVTRMTGIALSVGAVWWATRIGGVLGSLLASIPAWRQLDPLPVVGREEPDDVYWRYQDIDAYADEIAMSMVLDAPRSVEGMTEVR